VPVLYVNIFDPTYKLNQHGEENSAEPVGRLLSDFERVDIGLGLCGSSGRGDEKVFCHVRGFRQSPKPTTACQ
jgi:hypothetical protein